MAYIISRAATVRLHMDRQQLQKQVKALREDGKTIRAIASELGVPKSNVHRALKELGPSAGVKISMPLPFDTLTSPDSPSASQSDRPRSYESNMNLSH